MDNYPANTNLRVEVIPAGATEPISFADVRTDRTGFVELNHVGDDCFANGGAPDIIPGDTIRVSDGGAISDTSIVQDVMLTQVAGTDPLRYTEVDPATHTITVRGWAKDAATGAGLTNIEVRLNHPNGSWDADGANGRRDWRLAPSPDPATGAYMAVFEGASDADLEAAIDAEVAAEWLGSNELTVFDGFGSACTTDAARNTVIPPPFTPTPRPVATPTSPASPGAQPTVVTNTIIRTVPVAGSQAVLPQTLRSLAVSRLSLARRISVTRLRLQGLRASMLLPAGTKAVRVSVYKARNGKKTGRALFTVNRAPRAVGVYRLTLRNRALLRKLRTGSYVMEVRAGRNGAELGSVRRIAFTVTR
ncbi:MAG TPA: hypothetical protein VHF51_02560 [Solirubrobacteraceae bacterium]|nr:hypothetical protein [Solirubrobacteraceae bacterium]